MSCEIHNFDPQLAWGTPYPQINQYELKVKCTNCGKIFTFYERLDDVIAFCTVRAMQRKMGFKTMRW